MFSYYFLISKFLHEISKPVFAASAFHSWQGRSLVMNLNTF